MASSPSKEQCLLCSLSESTSEDVNWVQCGKCNQWAHFSCAGVDQEVTDTDWRCAQCVSSDDQQLKVPEAGGKKKSRKSGQKVDGRSNQGIGSDRSDIDPEDKRLEEEQLAKEKAFAKRMEARRKLLARQKAWKEEQLKQEREMREMEHQMQREMEEQQLHHEKELLV